MSGGRLSAADGWALLALQSTLPESVGMAGTFTTALRYVSEKRKLGEFAPATARERWYILARFADTVGPDRTPARVTRAHVEKWLMTRDIAPETKRKELSTVRSFCSWCVEHGLMRHNPCMGIKGPKAPRREPRGFTQPEVQASLEHADARLRVAILLCIQEGLRIGAVARLTNDRVDLDQRSVLALEKGNKEVWKPLSDETAEAIKAYLEEHPARYGEPLIRSYKEPGARIGARYLGRMISKVLYDAGVKERGFDGRSAHAYRHSCANDMLDNGADIRDVQEMLGHEHLSSTEIYLRRQRALGRLRDAAGGRSYVNGT